MREGIEKGGGIPPKREEEKGGEASRREVYLYKDAGIEERHGAIPLWLQLVAYGLIVWAIYYTIRYWSVG